MKPFRNFILVVVVLPLSWFAMLAIHEIGHVLAAWASGGGVVRVTLHRWWTFSQTNLFVPHPLFVTWAGPVFGSGAPLVLWLLVWLVRMPGRRLAQFFAGFCLIANGAYLGLGWINGAGDAGDLVYHGAARWQLVGFGVATVTLGLWLWHRLGPRFGLVSPPPPDSAGGDEP